MIKAILQEINGTQYNVFFYFEAIVVVITSGLILTSVEAVSRLTLGLKVQDQVC